MNQETFISITKKSIYALILAATISATNIALGEEVPMPLVTPPTAQAQTEAETQTQQMLNVQPPAEFVLMSEIPNNAQPVKARFITDAVALPGFSGTRIINTQDEYQRVIGALPNPPIDWKKHSVISVLYPRDKEPQIYKVTNVYMTPGQNGEPNTIYIGFVPFSQSNPEASNPGTQTNRHAVIEINQPADTYDEHILFFLDEQAKPVEEEAAPETPAQPEAPAPTQTEENKTKAPETKKAPEEKPEQNKEEEKTPAEPEQSGGMQADNTSEQAEVANEQTEAKNSEELKNAEEQAENPDPEKAEIAKEEAEANGTEESGGAEKPTKKKPSKAEEADNTDESEEEPAQKKKEQDNNPDNPETGGDEQKNSNKE